MTPVTVPIPGRIEDSGIQKPDNEITDITNGALHGNYGERFVQCSLRGCHLNENGSQSLPYRGEDHRRSHSDNEDMCAPWGRSYSEHDGLLHMFLFRYKSVPVSLCTLKKAYHRNCSHNCPDRYKAQCRDSASDLWLEWRIHIFGRSPSSRFQKPGMRRSGTDNLFQDGRNRQPLILGVVLLVCYLITELVSLVGLMVVTTGFDLLWYLHPIPVVIGCIEAIRRKRRR